MLKGKTVLLGVTGGIACYKSAGLASALVKQGANVQVLMTRNATEFIGPHTFESLTGNRVSVDTFDRNYQFQVEHIALADQADLVLVAPATANVLAKLSRLSRSYSYDIAPRSSMCQIKNEAMAMITPTADATTAPFFPLL